MRQLWLEKSKSRAWLKSEIRKRLDKNGYHRITISVYNLTQNATLTENQAIRELIKVFNKYERKDTRVRKRKNTREVMHDNRFNYQVPIVFYLCSRHQDCAKDHVAFQGKIYIDRYWRSLYKKSEQPEFLINAIDKFVKRNKVHTLQWVMSSPVYMTTRPYCRHYFTPVQTYDILTTEIKAPYVRKSRKKKKDNVKVIEEKVEKMKKK